MFRTARNIVSQAVIPALRQSLGGTERRHGHFRMVVGLMIGNKKPNSSGKKELVGFAEMATMHLNSQVQQFAGSTHGQRVSGRTSKMPIGTAGNPYFEYFTTPVEAPTTKTHHLLGMIRQISQASLTADFSGKLNSALQKRIRESKTKHSL